MFQHIHQALSEVRELRRRILDKQRFKGYSGRARAISGCLALIGAAVIGLDFVPRSDLSILAVWTAVCIAAVGLNYGAVLYWFLYNDEASRDPRRLKPLGDVAPAFLLGAALTAVLVWRGDFSYLYGTWMGLFGLANFASRHSLPPAIVWVGWFYLMAGIICLAAPALDFHNPWMMGLVFFAGEWFGGFLLHFDERKGLRGWASFFGVGGAENQYEREFE